MVNVLFSIGGKYYTGDPIVYDTPEDKIFEDSRNITIKLHHRIGRFVKLRFGFAARWIMISEITFDSGECWGARAREPDNARDANGPNAGLFRKAAGMCWDL